MGARPTEATPASASQLAADFNEHDAECAPEFTEAYAERVSMRQQLRDVRVLYAEERAKLTSKQWQRPTVLEPVAFAGRPLAPLGRLRLEGESSLKVAEYPTLGWRLTLPRSEANAVTVPADVVELYLWLVDQWRRMPDRERRSSGYVDFTMGAALAELGWCPRDVDDGATQASARRPSGRAYQKLRDGLQYLMGLRIGADDVPVPTKHGTTRALDEFVILQRVQLGNRRPGAGRVGKGVSQLPSTVQFSSGMVDLLSADAVALDADMLLDLPSGLPRMLYRVLCWARHDDRRGPGGTLELGVPELFRRLGYLHTRDTHARAREMLGTAHEVLENHGVLTRLPEHATRDDGSPVIRYSVVDLSASLTHSGLLTAVAISYGVVPNIARGLAERLPAQFERVLAAVSIGLIVPHKDLGSAVNYYTSHELPIDDNGRRWGKIDPATRLSDGASYLRWAALRRAALVEKRRTTVRWRPHDLPEGLTLVEEAMQNRKTRRAIKSDWLTEGLAELRLQHDLRVQSFEQWRRRGRPSW